MRRCHRVFRRAKWLGAHGRSTPTLALRPRVTCGRVSLTVLSAVSLAFSRQAHAAQVFIVDRAVVFEADVGETNVVDIVGGPSAVTITDSGSRSSAIGMSLDPVNVVLVPGAGCSSRGPTIAVCSARRLDGMHVHAGGGDDAVGLTGVRIKAAAWGGSGNDRLVGGSLDDLLDGGDGGDLLSGGPGDDRLRGRGGPDILDGGDGSDRLVGGRGPDRFDGGPLDLDVASYADRDESVTITLDGKANDGAQGEADNVLTNVDQVVGGKGNDVLRVARTARLSYEDAHLEGGPGNDRILGGPASDHLFGQGGDDRIEGRGGDDLITGGAGADSATGGRGRDFLSGDFGPDVLSGGRGADQLIGGPGRDVLRAGPANDVLYMAHGGGDRANCGTGYDRVVHGAGNLVAGDCEPERRLLPPPVGFCCGEFTVRTVRATARIVDPGRGPRYVVARVSVNARSVGPYTMAMVLVRLFDASQRELSRKNVVLALNRDVRVGNLRVPYRARTAQAHVV